MHEAVERQAGHHAVRAYHVHDASFNMPVSRFFSYKLLKEVLQPVVKRPRCAALVVGSGTSTFPEELYDEWVLTAEYCIDFSRIYTKLATATLVLYACIPVWCRMPCQPGMPMPHMHVHEHVTLHTPWPVPACLQCASPVARSSKTDKFIITPSWQQHIPSDLQKNNLTTHNHPSHIRTSTSQGCA